MGRRNKVKFKIFEEVEVLDAGSEGKAVAKIEDKVIFVPFVVPGDVIDIQLTRKKKNYLEGKAIKFHKYSDIRIKAKCEHFGICGGCKWQVLEYDQQLKYKHKQVKDNLERIAKVELPEIKPIIGSKEIYFYRNKLEYTFSNKKWLTKFDPDNKPDEKDMNGLGFHMPGMFDRIVDIENCYLQADPSNVIRLELKKFALENNLSFYNVKTWEGFLRNVIIRNTNRGDLMVIVIFRDPETDKINSVMEHLKTKFTEITSLMYIVNQKRNDDIFDQEVCLYSGEAFMIAEMPSVYKENKILQFKIQPKSFYQTNSDQAFELYKIAADFADLQGHEHVYDLYTGTGTIANFIADSAKKVIGLEYVQSAVEDAFENSKLNKIGNTDFYAGEIEKIMDVEFVAKHGKPDVIITDPPRAGMHPKVVDQILKIEPGKIVYISCNPATQARDIALMDEFYKVERVQPVDMFPHTQHVENVVLLIKR
jgi:23S rRNA (uracil1939-C5)-methyltransferase